MFPEANREKRKSALPSRLPRQFMKSDIENQSSTTKNIPNRAQVRQKKYFKNNKQGLQSSTHPRPINPRKNNHTDGQQTISDPKNPAHLPASHENQHF
jgi:hypothetical protein